MRLNFSTSALSGVVPVTCERVAHLKYCVKRHELTRNPLKTAPSNLLAGILKPIKFWLCSFISGNMIESHSCHFYCLIQYFAYRPWIESMQPYAFGYELWNQEEVYKCDGRLSINLIVVKIERFIK